MNLPWLDGVESAKQAKRLPVVLTQAEAAELLARMSGTAGLIARLLYGAGLRLMEAVRLRVKDLELNRREILVRDGKGAKDRVTVLPQRLLEPLAAQLACADACKLGTWRQDFGAVSIRRTHWIESIRTRRGSGRGSRVPVRSLSSTRAQGCAAGITSTNSCAARYARGVAGGGNPKPATPHSFEALLCYPLCCSPATTSGPCRNCWVTQMFRQR